VPDLAADLLARYRSLGLDPPPWAYPLPPSIPFVGKDYGRWGGILVYASAENLSRYVRDPKRRPTFLQDERVLNRHRTALEEYPVRFFPQVHMAPFSDGSLLVATWYYVWRRFGDPPSEPRALIESIAAANFCKFSLDEANNRDYAGHPRKLAISVPYVEADLRILRPATVILPRSIWKHREIQEAVRAAAPKACVVPLPQFNPRVVNIHLAKHEERAQTLAESLRATVLAAWVPRLKGYRNGRPYRFLVEMEDALASPPSPPPPLSPP